jgi:hypothetical protein
LPLANVQHLSFAGSLEQSLACVQIRTVSVPLQFGTNVVGQLALHVAVIGDAVQAGAGPPLKTIDAQQMGAPAPHCEGPVHDVLPSVPPSVVVV